MIEQLTQRNRLTRQVLQELNDNIVYEGFDEDVDLVLKESAKVSEGKLSKPGFVKAISLWYSFVNQRDAYS